jgi:hypothetical protein
MGKPNNCRINIPVPIKTWAQYHDIAEFFNGKEIDGQTIYGAGTAFKRKGQSYWTYLAWRLRLPSRPMIRRTSSIP